MPRLIRATPKYCHHGASGQAVVTIQGRDYYLGPHGTKASKIECDRLVGECLAHSRVVALVDFLHCCEHHRHAGAIIGPQSGIRIRRLDILSPPLRHATQAPARCPDAPSTSATKPPAATNRYRRRLLFADARRLF